MSFAPILVGTGLAGWSILSRTRERQQAAFDQSPQIASDTRAFKEKIASVRTSDDLLKDRQLLRVALGAFGLDADIDNRAFIKKVFDSDASDEKSFANRLSDKRYLALAQTFGFAGTAGPRISGSALPSELQDRLKDIATPDDLLSDGFLLRQTLKTFGLEGDANNTSFLRSVLESDISDPASFANRLSDKRYVKMAEALDFATRNAPKDGLAGFVEQYEAAAGKLDSVDDLLGNERLLAATLDVFGLERKGTSFLRQVLTSDWTNPSSFASLQTDKRYKALSAAFNFGGPPVAETRAARFVKALSGRLDGIQGSHQVTYDRTMREPTMAFFGLDDALASYGPDLLGQRAFLDRVLTSDPSNPRSLVGFSPDKRYYAVSRAFGFNKPEPTRSYPDGFADEITRRYADRQFEIGVGESDQDMRIALSLERELSRIAESSSSSSAQWFNVMSSPPLRQAFEAVFQFPSSFGTLDVDQQLVRFQERSQAMFGTRNVSDYLEPERLDGLRRKFLIFSAMESGQTSGPASAALALLSRRR